MSTNLERLLTVQERDRHIAQLTRESKDIPARQAEIEARLKEHRDHLHAGQEDLKKKSAATHHIEAEIDGLKQKITKFREQQFQIKSNVEYKALEKEIAGVQQEIRSQEDRELAVLEEIELAKGDTAQTEGVLKAEEAQAREEVQALSKRLEGLELEISGLRADRDALAVDVDAEWLSRYNRIMENKGDVAIVPIENGACGGCHMNVTTQTVHDVRKALAMVRCTYCGRILYWKP